MKPQILLIGIALAFVLVISGCVQEGEGLRFKLPDTFINVIGGIVAVLDSNPVTKENWIRSDDCGIGWIENNTAPCIRIPLSLIDYNSTYYEKTGEYRHFTNNLSCGREFKPYCQIKMDNEIIIKEGCFDLGLDAITVWCADTIAQGVDITRSHVFTICCSATDSKEEFDVCKSYVMDKIC